MSAAAPRLIIIDTNAYLRLYCSPVLPLLLQEIAGYKLVTLKELIDEFYCNPSLVSNYSWVASGARALDLQAAALPLSHQDKRDIAAEKDSLRPYANALLRKHCEAKRLNPVRELSRQDLSLLATAVVFDAIIITDEWPLRFVIDDLMQEPDDYRIDYGGSLEVLKFLEENGLLSREKRIETCLSWISLREKLPADWRTSYKALFGEDAPE